MTEQDIKDFSYLIVDDDDFSLEIMTNVLICLGVNRIHTAQDAALAYRLAQQYRPDFVLLDIYMPGLDGWALLDQLRQLLPKIVVIMVTGSILPADFTKSMDQRVDGYCIKPVSSSIMSKSLMRAWQRRQLAAS
ncbi:MAG TPA: response regulator [Rhodoferax sp.]|nr:response regulator [Rhodoferax sp.]